MDNGENIFSDIKSKHPGIYEADFTFCVPDCWAPVIDELSGKLKRLLDQFPDYRLDVSDVKEKWGQLRFYYALKGPEEKYFDIDAHIEQFIDEAEEAVSCLWRAQLVKSRFDGIDESDLVDGETFCNDLESGKYD